ncbi:MAG: DUF4058 domain-containing protein [Gemmataceae bacterium]|nr:DUF4058 domain-containing protein [Gemmataceae bacterium]
MSMHDWTRVTPNEYHSFHVLWLAHLTQALNTGVLPAGYGALADYTAPPYVPDVVTLATGRRGRATPAGRGATATTAAPLATLTADGTVRKRPPAGRRRVMIQQTPGRQVVAVIEVVSPSNKAKRAEFDDLVGKSVQLLLRGVHVLLIDPLPPTRRDPHGLHATVWKELTGKRSVPPADKPLTLASYAARGGDRFSAFVEPVAVGDPVPDLPLFLRPEFHVTAPLEQTYQAAWAGVPDFVREAVEGRDP